MIMYQMVHKEGHYSGPFFELKPSVDYSKVSLITTDMTSESAARELAELRSQCQQQQVLLTIASNDIRIVREARAATTRVFDSIRSELEVLKARAQNGCDPEEVIDRISLILEDHFL